MTSTTISTNFGEEEEVQQPMEIESLCMNCYENGLTKLLSVRIPFYKQIILMSFFCEHCAFKNSEIQSGEPAQEYGTEIVLKIQETKDLNRTIVKSEYASIEIPEVELFIQPKTQPGEVTNVEGIISRVITGLQQNQEIRKKQDPEQAQKIDLFIERLHGLMQLKEQFTLKLNDPTGNCFIQNPDPLHVDPRCITSHYSRTLEQNKLLGFVDDNDVEGEVSAEDREWKSYEDCKQEILHFKGSCQACGAPVETLMKPTDIPFFNTVIIMSTCCDFCGFKSNDVKSGGATQEMGCKLSVKIEKDIDMARDILKSDTCSLYLPELEIEMGAGALSGRFTTVEGLLTACRDQLKQQFAFFMGDSATEVERQKIERKLEEMDQVLALKKPCTLILDDPAGNSYIMSLTAPLIDERLKKEYYKRTYEQDDDLGINDMKVENYQALDDIVEDEKEDVRKEE